MTMQFVLVKSTNVHAIAYDKAKSVLYVEFKGKKSTKPGVPDAPGDVYAYDGVTAVVHGALMAQKSPGRYIMEHIRGKYPTRKEPKPL